MSIPFDRYILTGGEIAKLIRDYDWGKTSLGHFKDWPQSLLTAVSILVSAKVPMALWWGKDHILIYNDIYIPCLGDTDKHPHVFGKAAHDAWHQTTEKFQNIKTAVFGNGEAFLDDEVIVHALKDGKREKLCWSFSYAPIRDETGEVAGIFITANETTLMNDTVSKLELSRKRFDNLVKQSTVGIIVLIGEEMNVEIVNKAYGKLIGKTPGALMHQPLFEVIPEAEKDFRPILEKVRTTGETIYLHGQPYFSFVEEEKKTGYLDLIYQPFLEEQGEIAGVMVVCNDVTPAVETRLKLEDEKERTRLALDAADLGLFEIDLKTDAIITNKRFRDIYGFEHEATRNEYVTAYHPGDKQIRDQAVKESEKTGMIIFEVRIIHQDGSIRWIRLHSKILRNELNEPFRLYGVVADITEEKNFQDQLAHASEELAAINEELRAANEEMASSNEELAESNNKLFRVNADLDNFIYTASHDLKAPFNNLEGLMNTLLSEVELQPDLMILKDMVDASFLRFRKTLEHLTDISKLQREADYEEELIDLQEMVQDSISDIRQQIDQSSAVIETSFEVRNIRFSPKNLRSILYNLISNAIKYRSPERFPEVKVRSFTKDQYIVLQVSDNGLGLSENNKSVIFGMFKRAHDHVEGSGIGLFIVKKIVENAGGKIEVESEVGKGSTFLVYLKNTVGEEEKQVKSVGEYLVTVTVTVTVRVRVTVRVTVRGIERVNSDSRENMTSLFSYSPDIFKDFN